MNAILTHAEVEAAIVAACASIHQPGTVLTWNSPYRWAMEKAAMSAMAGIDVSDAVTLHEFFRAERAGLSDADDGGPRETALSAAESALERFLIFARSLSRDDALTRGMFLLRLLRFHEDGEPQIPGDWHNAAVDALAEDVKTLAGKGA